MDSKPLQQYVMPIQQMYSRIGFYRLHQCYKPQSAEIAGILNFARQIFSFTVGFYAIPLGEKIGFDWCWVTFAFIHLFFFIPMMGLMIRGERWRKTLPLPNFEKDL